MNCFYAGKVMCWEKSLSGNSRVLEFRNIFVISLIFLDVDFQTFEKKDVIFPREENLGVCTYFCSNRFLVISIYKDTIIHICIQSDLHTLTESLVYEYVFYQHFRKNHIFLISVGDIRIKCQQIKAHGQNPAQWPFFI